MSGTRRVNRIRRSFSLEGTVLEDHESAFYWLWIFATTTYGVGDLLTTMVIWYFDGLTELNALVAAALSTSGRPGLVALKLLVIVATIGLQVAVLRSEDPDWVSILGPPILLGMIGLAVTTYNLWLLLVVA